MKDHTASILIVLAVVVAALVLLGRERLDNPLFFLSIMAIFTAGFFAFGRWVGVKTSSPGLVTFFGGAGTNA